MNTVSFTANGLLRTLEVEPRTTLLEALREELGLTGPKKSCDRGECSACLRTIAQRAHSIPVRLLLPEWACAPPGLLGSSRALDINHSLAALGLEVSSENE